MSPSSWGTRIVVLASLLFAMILRIVPVSGLWFDCNPDWVLLFLIYWAMAIPDRVGVGYGWSMGLFADALTGRMLGQHALAYCVVAYLCVKSHRNLRRYPVYQQMVYVLFLLLLSQLLIFWTQDHTANSAIGLAYWLPPLAGAALWPVVFFTLRRLRRSFNIL